MSGRGIRYGHYCNTKRGHGSRVRYRVLNVPTYALQLNSGRLAQPAPTLGPHSRRMYSGGARQRLASLTSILAVRLARATSRPSSRSHVFVAPRDRRRTAACSSGATASKRSIASGGQTGGTSSDEFARWACSSTAEHGRHLLPLRAQLGTSRQHLHLRRTNRQKGSRRRCGSMLCNASVQFRSCSEL